MKTLAGQIVRGAALVLYCGADASLLCFVLLSIKMLSESKIARRTIVGDVIKGMPYDCTRHNDNKAGDCST